ncbi:MAG: Kae1-associated kinase Bud32 [Acidilobus sp.]
MVWKVPLTLDWTKGMRLVKQGAESIVLQGDFLDMKAVFKLRVPKPYMHPALDSRLRYQRTLKEARVLATATASGVNVPRLYAVYPSMGLIVMEYIEGPTLKEYVGLEGWRDLVMDAGAQLGLLHRAGVVHGDSTTSNIVVRGGRAYLIDFGLAEFSRSEEDRAVDLHLFREAVLSTHPSLSSELFDLFVRGYESTVGTDEVKAVLKRVRDVEMRGRYVTARRTVWRG